MLSLSGVAHADPDAGGDPVGAQPKLITPTATGAPTTIGNEQKYSHLGQLEIAVRAGVGLRTIVPYSDEDYCGKIDRSTAHGNAAVCTERQPFGLDFELGYGVARHVDLLAEMSVGLEGSFAPTAADEGGPHDIRLAPGARFFFSDAGTSKLFTTAQVVLDFSGYKDDTGKSRGVDFGIRNMSGLQFDLDKAYGFYIFVGETVTFARWLDLDLEAGVGIQGRFL
ncbi:MAG TPA: hypothetical protein VGM88_23085 [Kofleriaceae bacterium]